MDLYPPQPPVWDGIERRKRAAPVEGGRRRTDPVGGPSNRPIGDRRHPGVAPVELVRSGLHARSASFGFLGGVVGGGVVLLLAELLGAGA